MVLHDANKNVFNSNEIWAINKIINCVRVNILCLLLSLSSRCRQYNSYIHTIIELFAVPNTSNNSSFERTHDITANNELSHKQRSNIEHFYEHHLNKCRNVVHGDHRLYNATCCKHNLDSAVWCKYRFNNESIWGKVNFSSFFHARANVGTCFKFYVRCFISNYCSVWCTNFHSWYDSAISLRSYKFHCHVSGNDRNCVVCRKYGTCRNLSA